MQAGEEFVWGEVRVARVAYCGSWGLDYATKHRPAHTPEACVSIAKNKHADKIAEMARQIGATPEMIAAIREDAMNSWN